MMSSTSAEMSAAFLARRSALLQVMVCGVRTLQAIASSAPMINGRQLLYHLPTVAPLLAALGAR